MTCQVSLGVKLFFNFHLIQQISRSGIFVHDEENVADVDNDTALVIGGDIGCRRRLLPNCGRN